MTAPTAGQAGADNASNAKTYTQQDVDAEVGGLKAKNTELLGEVRKLKDAVAPWQGLDPEKVKAALEAQTTAQAEQQKKAGDWDAREKTLRDGFKQEHDKVVVPLTERVSTMEQELFEAVAGRDAVEAINLPSVKGNAKLLLPIIRPELGVVLVDGKRVTVVKGPDGKPRYHPTTNALVTVEDRLKELRAVPDYAGAFEGVSGSGSGARPSAGASQGGVVTLTREQASDAQQYAAALKQVNGDYAKVKVADVAA
jgi:hypothetical protein